MFVGACCMYGGCSACELACIWSVYFGRLGTSIKVADFWLLCRMHVQVMILCVIIVSDQVFGDIGGQIGVMNLVLNVRSGACNLLFNKRL